MKKILMILGGIFLFIILAFIVAFLIISFTTNKLVCESNEGNITIMYTDKTISGYTASGLLYNLEDQKEYAEELSNKLKAKGIRAEVDDSNEKIGYKIRKAQLEKVPYMLVVGAKEVEENMVAVRSRKVGDIGQMPIDEFITKIQKEIETKAID